MKLKQLFENEVPKINDPKQAYEYALTQDKRIPELEPTILKDPQYAYVYVTDIIKGRWPEAEPIIMKDPGRAYGYARDIVNGRWLEAEPVILKDPMWANEYLQLFPEARTPSKDVPLVLGEYAIMDVPNTITDEQLEKLIKLIEPLTTKTWPVLFYRLYSEPDIKQQLAKNKLKQITIKQLMNDENLKYKFLFDVDCCASDTDFN